MHKIITVTLNPCIDKTASIEKLEPYGLNRIRSERLDPAGKGINVARILRTAGADVSACGFIAGKQGEFLLESVRGMGIPTDFLEVEGETRVNLKLLDESVQKITEVNEPGFPVPPEKLELFFRRFESLTRGASMVVLSGSLPRGVPATVYRDCIAIARRNGAKAILDADGAPLAEGVTALPYAVKPNSAELERLVGRKLETLSEIYDAAQELIAAGIAIVLVSMGADGALFLDKTSAYATKPWKIDVKSPTGSGDSMVSALVWALQNDMPSDAAARLATAAGTFTASLPGTQLCRMEDALACAEKVELWPYSK